MSRDALSLLRDLDAWNAAASSERRAAALAAARLAPRGLEFVELAKFTLGGRTHEIARFSSADGATFSLVPGSPDALLGRDPAEPFRPTQRQDREWRRFAEETGWTLADFFEQAFCPLRRVAIAPAWVEAAPRSFSCGADGDDFQTVLAESRAACGEDFRLPTADEWEYWCAAGTRTLFRWGDDSPASNSEGETTFDRHRRPNAFGLTFGPSTYHVEIGDGPVYRNGDGGTTVCGGAKGFPTWIPFASAFALPREATDDWYLDDAFVRRARTVELS